jgi:hypothetical protein
MGNFIADAEMLGWNGLAVNNTGKKDRRKNEVTNV